LFKINNEYYKFLYFLLFLFSRFFDSFQQLRKFIQTDYLKKNRNKIGNHYNIQKLTLFFGLL
jgi:hypothetical protein